MKICYVANYIQIPYQGGKGSGGATHAYEVAKGLVERGQAVYLLCGIGLGQASSENIDGIYIKRMFRVPGKLYYVLKRNPLVWLFLRWPYHFLKHSYESVILVFFLLRNKCEIVYERSSLGTKIHSLIYWVFGINLVVEINDYQDSVSNSIAKAIITPNEAVIASRFKKKVQELSWGANTKIFFPSLAIGDLKHKYVIGDKKIVLIVCSGIPWHGLGDLIEAAGIIILERMRNNVVFMVVGGGSHFQEYKEKICSLGLNDKFIFTGVVDYANVPEFINMADVTVAPYNSMLHSASSHRELYACPLKVLEYMACAKPVVITKIANQNNIVEHMQTGVVIKTDSPEDLAAAILGLCDNEPLRFKLGMNARSIIENKFSWQNHVQELEKVLFAVQSGVIVHN